MLKLHAVLWFSRPLRKITAIAENHGIWIIITRSSVTAEKQRVSCACLSRLAN